MLLAFLTFSSIVLSSAAWASPSYYVVCDVTLAKSQEPIAKCSKKQQGKDRVSDITKLAHDDAFQRYQKQYSGYKCYRESEKDRIQMQVFTVCHNRRKTAYAVFITSIPRDIRAKIYFSGLKIPWYEQDVGMYLYKRYLLPQPSWKQWLIP